MNKKIKRNTCCLGWTRGRVGAKDQEEGNNNYRGQTKGGELLLKINKKKITVVGDE